MTMGGFIGELQQMWATLAAMSPDDVACFAYVAAREIPECIIEAGLGPDTDEDNLLLLLPMPFARAMALTTHPRAREGVPSSANTGLLAAHEAIAAGCRRQVEQGAGAPIALCTELAYAAACAFRGSGGTTPEDAAEAVFAAYVSVLAPEAERVQVRLLWQASLAAWSGAGRS